MKFYIATSLSRAADHNRLRDSLQAAGHTITYDWTVHGSVKHTTRERLGEVALAETQGVLAADVVIVLLPGGFGTHTELGMALGAGKAVIVVADPLSRLLEPGDQTCAFYHHPDIVRVEHTDAVEAHLKRLPARRAKDRPLLEDYAERAKERSLLEDYAEWR